MIIHDERAQAATEVIGLVLVAVAVVVIVGFGLKSFVTGDVQPQIQDQLN
ncbi:MAG: hypothetical protein NUV67_03970 [archaeon]|nr:hypothetical protein [archaeon]